MHSINNFNLTHLFQTPTRFGASVAPSSSDLPDDAMEAPRRAGVWNLCVKLKYWCSAQSWFVVSVSTSVKLWFCRLLLILQVAGRGFLREFVNYLHKHFGAVGRGTVWHYRTIPAFRGSTCIVWFNPRDVIWIQTGCWGASSQYSYLLYLALSRRHALRLIHGSIYLLTHIGWRLAVTLSYSAYVLACLHAVPTEYYDALGCDGCNSR